MKELGDYLSEIRKNNGVGIEEASEDLNVSPNVLHNIESGNVRAFKDMLELREIVKLYSKYLGLNPDEVVDEFNDFLFEHTSKISLQDILDAEEKNKKNNSNDPQSPYTKSKTSKINKKHIKFGAIILLFVLFIVLVFLFLKWVLTVKNNVNTELLNNYNYEEVI